MEAIRISSAGIGEYVLALALMGAVAGMGLPFLRPLRGKVLLFGAAPFVITLGLLLLGIDPSGIGAAVLLNAYQIGRAHV